MVYLSRIYTKTGDAGETGLGDGARVSKSHPRVAAFGAVDELNATLGVALTQASDLDAEIRRLLTSIQHDLFDLGADLCTPERADEQPGQALRIVTAQVDRLEKAIDLYNARLQPLRSFVLPGGSAASAWMHLARTTCRRAERDLVTLMSNEAVNPQALIYLNRLSDLLFVLGRVCNANGAGDVLWQPGKNR